MTKKLWHKIFIEASRGTIPVADVNVPTITMSFIGNESIEASKELFRRALNCWEDAPGELKALGDCIEFSKPLQNYGTTVRINGSTH